MTRILIGTPCGGGVCSVQYLLSLVDTLANSIKMKQQLQMRNDLRAAKDQGVKLTDAQLNLLVQFEAMDLRDYEIGLYTLANESLLQRGRNHIAQVALMQNWDKLFFIDADAKWTWDQFRKLVDSPSDFVAGACPLKILPISLNYLPFQDDEHYYKDAMRSVQSLQAMRAGHDKVEIPIAYIGTAFMCLSKKVLQKMAEVSDPYQYPNPFTGNLETHWNIFDCKPMHEKFMSEDWSACEKARSLGFDVMLNSDVIISHVGSFIFTPEMSGVMDLGLRPKNPIQSGEVAV